MINLIRAVPKFLKVFLCFDYLLLFVLNILPSFFGRIYPPPDSISILSLAIFILSVFFPLDFLLFLGIQSYCDGLAFPINSLTYDLVIGFLSYNFFVLSTLSISPSLDGKVYFSIPCGFIFSLTSGYFSSSIA